MSSDWFRETLHADHSQQLKIERVLYHETTEHQDLMIFENGKFGRVMTLDGVVQVTEADNPIYHEMLAHLPILRHGAAGRVLVVGGGDGGMLRHVLMHPGVEQAVLVEIDAAVVEFSKTWLPMIGQDAFDDPRTEVIIADGARFMAQTDRRFDVIIVDSTDPIGPGAVLFEESFYADCKRCLTPGGVLVTQNGVPWDQGHEVTNTWRRFRDHFADRWFAVAPVPTYAGGFMAFGWGTDDPELRRTPVEQIADRFAAAGLETVYLTPELTAAAFVLPQYVRRLMTDA